MRLLFTLLLLLLAAACAPAAVSPPQSVSIDPTDVVEPTIAAASLVDATETLLPTSTLIETALAPVTELPAWQTLPVTNARTGETFTFADFAGQTVFVEPMATWCSNCRQQLGNVRSAREQLGENVIFVALSVETNISSADLAAYADTNSFEWHFAVMTPELLGELVNAFRADDQ
ncbi:MAG: redoxin domain-containing protein [Chloroflexi bacterium]|uniref:peroxiredoxin family protein n=1 Tax=Candidatus Flexifilum breve TaxID=3140694 RepID=UPI0031351207|nr:redoxin domain-containing protein [Chloroflexota bacterium]